MKIFPDTSSLFKLYHKESGTQALLETRNAKHETPARLNMLD
jgi:hypothetical protein